MQLYSTRNKNQYVSLGEAILKGLPDDNGLFMPRHIPSLNQDFIQDIKNYTFPELAFEVSRSLLQGAIPEADLKEMVFDAVDFPAPLRSLDGQKHILELFHGPSLAFKDFGARFMARLMSYFDRKNEAELVILVATSGDTGGAVAAGFHQTPGIRVVILYPSGKVSHLQELQLTTLGHNISALEINGTFDDCQALVKQAFLDKELNDNIRLTSANSINIARLIPQSFYYFEAYKQLDEPKNVVFSVPSGNFGNLTAGLFAQKMGLPVHHFIAATNANKVVPDYLKEGVYRPRPSVRTISNAMDVGNPSNFARMDDLYGSTWNIMKDHISGYSYTDAETEEAILAIKQRHEYIIDPHGAVAYLALLDYQKTHSDTQGIVLGTAHAAKFRSDMERVLGHEIEIPERLSILEQEQKQAVFMNADFRAFKSLLLKDYLTA